MSAAQNPGLWESTDGRGQVAIALQQVKYVRRMDDGWCRVMFGPQCIVDIRCSAQEYDDLLVRWNKEITK